MKKRYEKLIVIMLSLAMIFTGSVFAFAVEGQPEEGQSESVVNDESKVDEALPEKDGNEESVAGDAEEAALTAGADVAELEGEATLMESVSGDIEVKYLHSQSDGEKGITATYKDDFFASNNAKYNEDLSKFSLLTAMAAFDVGGDKPDKYIKSLLVDKLKFSNYEQNKYGTYDKSKDTVGYAVAEKTVGENKVVVIAVRGSGYGGEWTSNASVCGDGYTNEHNGFAKSAQYIYDRVQSRLGSNTKVWITGYSRGAAVANVLGKKIGDSGLISKDNMYCYTYETPTTTKKTGTDKAAQGVYNVVATSDLIPQLPFYSWGYGRYGTDKYVMSSKTSIRNYKDAVDNGVKTHFKDLTGKTYVAQPVWANNTLLKVLDSLVGADESTYYSKWQSIFADTLSTSLGGNSGGLSGIVSYASNFGLDSYLKDNGVKTDRISQHHYPEMLLAWMEKGSIKEENNYRYITISCKEGEKKSFKNCDITVIGHKKDGKTEIKVAEIKAGDYSSLIQSAPNFSLEVNYDDNGDLNILVPCDDTFKVVLDAKTNLVVDYKITEYTNGVASRIVEYKNIDVSSGKHMTASAPMDDVSDVSSYNPSVEESKIAPSRTITGSALRAVKTNVEVLGNMTTTGLVVGNGYYPEGTEITLAAYGKNFKGLTINGSLLRSNKYTYSISKSNNPRIQAVFSVPLSECDITVYNRTYSKSGGSTSTRVSYKGMTLAENSDFYVSYSNAKDVGNYTAVVFGFDNTNGTVYRTYSVMPYGTSMKSAKKAKKSFTAKWKKQSGKMPKSRITGYQVQYSTDGNFSWSKIATVKGYSKTSKKISKLASKATYYVRVRTYMKTKTGTVYSDWSNVKAVTTK